MTTLDPSDENQVRRSRRFKWTVLIGFALLAVATLLSVLFIPWDMRPQSTPDLDFKLPTVAPEQNAATYFEAAGKLQTTGFSREWTDLLDHGMNASGKPSWDPVFADEVLTANAATFAEMEKGLACQEYVSAPYFPDDAIQSFQAKKRLEQLLCLKSRRAQLAEDYAGAAKSALCGWRFSVLATNNSRVFIEWLVGESLERIALAQLEELSADAKIPAPALQEIKAALDQWSHQEANAGFKQMLKGDYEWIKKQRISDLRNRWLKKEIPALVWMSWIPYAYKPNAVNFMFAGYSRVLIANVDRPWSKTCFDYPWDIRYPGNGFDWKNLKFFAQPNSLGTLWFIQGAPGFPKGISRKCGTQALVDALRLKIALRLYEEEHWELPDDLNVLVPKFISAIPKDPYDDQPFRYSKARKKVWAVGSDLIDQGGLRTSTDPDTLSWNDRRGYDLVMPVSTRDPNPPSDSIPPP